MKCFLLAITLTLLTACSSKTTTVKGPIVVQLPSSCNTSEVARFHKGEELLLVYHGTKVKPAKMREDLSCLTLKGIGDGLNRFQINRSRKVFGVAILDLERMVVVRYAIDPADWTLVQETVIPTNEKKSEFKVRLVVFMAGPKEIAAAISPKVKHRLAPIVGGEGTFSKKELYNLINGYIKRAPELSILKTEEVKDHDKK